MSILRSLVVATIAATVPSFAAAATESIHREHVFSVRPGDTVAVDVSFHDLAVTARPGDTVEVTVDLEVSGTTAKVARLLEGLEPVFEQNGDRILIRSALKGGMFWSSGKTRGRVVVAMPPDLDLEVDTSSGQTVLIGDFGGASVAIDSSSGETRLEGSAEQISVDASSGSVRLELSRPAATLRLDTSSGSVHLTGGARSVTASSSSGSIDVGGLLGDATLDASSGGITAEWASIDPRTQVTVDTSSGGVRLRFPAGTVLGGQVDTSSGGIRTDFPGEISDRGGRLDLAGGPDAVQLRVDTSSGGVQLLAR